MQPSAAADTAQGNCPMSYVLCLMSWSPRVALNLHFVSAPSVPINRQPSQATLISRRHNARIFSSDELSFKSEGAVALAAGVALICPRCGTTTEKMRKIFIALQVSGLSQRTWQNFSGFRPFSSAAPRSRINGRPRRVLSHADSAVLKVNGQQSTVNGRLPDGNCQIIKL